MEEKKLFRVGRNVMGCWMETEMTEDQYEDKYDKGWRKVDLLPERKFGDTFENTYLR